MKRNIVTTIEFTKGKIAINVLEQLATNTIEIFNANDKITNVNIFFKKSFEQINNIIKGKIKNVFVVIEPSEKNVVDIKLVSNKISIVGNHISEKDINYLIDSTKEKYKEEGKEIILLHPLQFAVESIFKKIYSQAPINIKGDYVSATIAITYISLNVHKFIKSIFSLYNLNINQIFITTQTISNNYLSNYAIQKGSILVNFGDKQTFVSFNKNGGTVAHFNIYNCGFNQLIKNIKEGFNCTYEEANNLILIYGSLKVPEDEEIIYMRQEGIKEIRYTNKNLHNIIENFFIRTMSVIKKYIAQKNIKNIPLVISGKVTKIGHILEFSKHVLSKNVAIYNPIEYLETNTNNKNILGVLKIRETLNEILGKNLTTIVTTNPNSFEYLTKNSNKNKNIFNRLINKLGGKYDWNI